MLLTIIATPKEQNSLGHWSLDLSTASSMQDKQASPAEQLAIKSTRCHNCCMYPYKWDFWYRLARQLPMYRFNISSTLRTYGMANMRTHCQQTQLTNILRFTLYNSTSKCNMHSQISTVSLFIGESLSIICPILPSNAMPCHAMPCCPIPRTQPGYIDLSVRGTALCTNKHHNE